MEKKLIFFDIDGTLLAEGKTRMTTFTEEAIKKAQSNGHLCFINTGRPMGTIGRDIMEFPFDGYVCGCGTYITFRGKEILHTGIKQELLTQLIGWNKREQVDIFFEGQEGLIFPPESVFKDLTMAERYFKSQNVDVKYYMYDREANFLADKFTMWFDETDPPLVFRTFLEKYFSVIERDRDFWEVVPKGYSKATGIDVLLHYLGRDLEDTISIGDSSNDIAMLEHTKESVLMGNGDPELRKLVTHVTADVENEGVYHALKYFGLF